MAFKRSLLCLLAVGAFALLVGPAAGAKVKIKKEYITAIVGVAGELTSPGDDAAGTPHAAQDEARKCSHLVGHNGGGYINILYIYIFLP